LRITDVAGVEDHLDPAESFNRLRADKPVSV
jgi:hypothetical protein